MGRTQDGSAGRTVLVCGGAEGLGLAVAQAFAEAGARVVVTGRHRHAALYDADLARFDLLPLDLADRDEVAALAASVVRPDVLVVAEPPRLPATLDPHEREFLAQAAQLGLVGPLHLATRLRFRLAQSEQRGGGAVVVLPSAQGWFAMGAAAAEARAEVAACTRRLAASWATLGVRVNSVVSYAGPGPAGLRVQIDRQSGPLLTRSTPVRAATAEELADVALLLAGPGAAALTGQVLTVDAPR